MVDISFVQSLAVVMPCGLGANRAANSTLPVSTRSSDAFSQVQPPCIAVLTITAGKASFTRGSIAARIIVCVPPPLAPVIAMRSGSTSGRLSRKSSERIGVPRLQAHDALQMRLGLRAEEAPVLGRVHLGALLGEAVDQLGRELDRVGIAEHVPLPDDAAHPGKLDAHRLKAAAAAALEAFLAGGDFFPDGVVARLGQPGVLPMAMREQHAGDFARDLLRPVEIAGDEEAGGAFEVDFFDRVVGPLDLAVDDRVQRRLGRHRPEAFGHEDLPPHAFGPSVPFGLRLRRREWEVAVEILERLQPSIVGQACRPASTRGADAASERAKQSAVHATIAMNSESSAEEACEMGIDTPGLSRQVVRRKTCTCPLYRMQR